MFRYNRIATRALLCAGIASLSGCQYNKDAQKEIGQIECNVSTHLDCYLNEVRESFNKGFDPEAQEYKSHFMVVYTDGRSFFSYRAEYFSNNGKWLHGGEVVKVGTMDVRSGKKLTIADVIPEDKYGEALARVKAAVIAKIGGEENLMPSAEDVLVTLSENFYVGKDGLHFIFPEYSVVPYHYASNMYGSVEVVIPAYGSYRQDAKLR